MWILYVCFGITWAGCGGVNWTEFRSIEDCERALSKMHIAQNGQAVTGGNGRQVIAYCRPKDGIK